MSSNIKNRISNSWDISNIKISHNIIEYNELDSMKAKNDSNSVRLHFGLQGSYHFSFAQLNNSFSLTGHHNNIMYTNGLELEVYNKSRRIETFGVDFNTNTFIEIGQKGNETLKRFTDKVINQENSILSQEWKTNNFRIQQVINEIINCNYQDELKELFLLSKSIELLVLQADTYEQQDSDKFIKTAKDKQKLIEAKELITSRIENPPTIVELSKLIGINEYKLKKGFKELFGTTVFGYIHKMRMSMAKKLLLGTDKTAKEIAYEAGYSSPQHFANAFKKEFGISPNSVRKNPSSVISKNQK